MSTSMICCLAIAAVCVTAQASAQAPLSDEPPRARPAIDLSLSGAFLLPGAGSGSTGFGPLGGVQVRWPVGQGRLGLVAGLAYGVVFTDGFRVPDGTRYATRPEAFVAALGPQWIFGARRHVALDLQWNPTVGRTATPGPQPAWRQTNRPWTTDLSAVSVGARYALASRRGPEVALVGRLYTQVNPYLASNGAFGVAPTFGLALRPR